MNSTYLKLKAATIEHLSCGDHSKVYLFNKSGEWTRPQLIEAIQNDHPQGVKLISNLVKLSLDLVLRGKEKLVDFEMLHGWESNSEAVNFNNIKD